MNILIITDMTQSEKSIENSIKKYLNDLGCYVIKYHGGGYSRVGVPDILACYRGIFLGIEVKNSKGKTSPLQDANIDLINRAGGHSIVARSLQDVKELLAEVDQRLS